MAGHIVFTFFALGLGMLLLWSYNKPDWLQAEAPSETIKKLLGLTLLAAGLVWLFVTAFILPPIVADDVARTHVVQELKLKPSDEIELVGTVCRTASRSSCRTWDAQVQVNGEYVANIVFDISSARLEYP